MHLVGFVIRKRTHYPSRYTPTQTSLCLNPILGVKVMKKSIFITRIVKSKRGITQKSQRIGMLGIMTSDYLCAALTR